MLSSVVPVVTLSQCTDQRITDIYLIKHTSLVSHYCRLTEVERLMRNGGRQSVAPTYPRRSGPSAASGRLPVETAISIHNSFITSDL